MASWWINRLLYLYTFGLGMGFVLASDVGRSFKCAQAVCFVAWVPVISLEKNVPQAGHWSMRNMGVWRAAQPKGWTQAQPTRGLKQKPLLTPPCPVHLGKRKRNASIQPGFKSSFPKFSYSLLHLPKTKLSDLIIWDVYSIKMIIIKLLYISILKSQSECSEGDYNLFYKH